MRTFSILVLAFFMGCVGSNEPPTKETVKPTLTYLQVDELKDELILHGEFGTPVDSVICDAITLEIISANDTIVIAKIPARGKGSCGEVIAKSKGLQSNVCVLSMWHFYNWYNKYRGYPSGGYEGVINMDTVHIRADTSILGVTKVLYVLPTSASLYNQSADGFDGQVFKYTGPKYNRGGKIKDTFVFNDYGKLIYDACRQRYMYLDSLREVVHYSEGDSYCGNQGFGFCNHGGASEPAQFVR